MVDFFQNFSEIFPKMENFAQFCNVGEMLEKMGVPDGHPTLAKLYDLSNFTLALIYFLFLMF